MYSQELLLQIYAEIQKIGYMFLLLTVWVHVHLRLHSEHRKMHRLKR